MNIFQGDTKNRQVRLPVFLLLFRMKCAIVSVEIMKLRYSGHEKNTAVAAAVFFFEIYDIKTKSSSCSCCLSILLLQGGLRP